MKMKFNQIALVSAALLAGLLSHPDTVLGQSSGLSFSPNTISLSATVGQTSPAQLQVTVTNNGNPVSPLSATATDANGQTVSWLTVTSTTGTSQSFLTVIGSPGGLQPGTYNGFIVVNAAGTTAKLSVTFTIYSSVTLTADQSTLTFVAQAGAAAPASQVVNITSATAGIPITVAATTTSGGSWLSAVANSTSVPAAVTVAVNPSSLAAGSYTGTVTVSAPQAQAAPVNITVNLTVAPQPVLSATPNPVTMVYQSGSGAATPSANISIQSSSSTSQLGFVGTLSYPTSNTCGTWLNATNLVGTTPASVTVTPNSSILTGTQTCTATITMTSPSAANPTLTIPITLNVNPLPLLNVTPSSLTFNYSVGGAIPQGQAVSVTNSGTNGLNFAVSTQTPWLSLPATPAGGFAPGSSVTVNLNQSQLPLYNPGTYSGVVNISALGAANTATVPVTLTISNNPLLTITPPFANFNYQIGGTAPSNISLNIATTAGSLPFTLAVPSTSATQFATFTPSSGTATTTPTPISIALNTSLLQGFQPGTYTNAIQVTAGGAGANNPPQTIQVTVNVTNSAQLNVTPEALYFTQTGNTAAASQLLNVTSTSGNPTVTVTPSVPWIVVSGSGSATPANITVGIAANNGLTPGAYSGSIAISSATQTITVPVQLAITSGVALNSGSQSLTFTQATGGTAPAAQTVNLTTTNSASVPYSVNVVTNTGTGWLSVVGNSNGTFTGTAPGSFQVAVNGSTLTPGTYNGSVIVYAAGASTTQFTIPVTLTVTPPATLAANPASLSFSATNPFSNPANQTVQITAAGSTPVSFTASATSQGNWLSVTSPASGASATTPASVTVAVSVSGLAAGTYNGTVTLTPSGSGTTPLTIPVTLTVGAQTAPSLAQVTNAASSVPGPIAPGELITIKGTNLGPGTPAGTQLNAAGTSVLTTLAGVQVTFDGVPSPLLYVSAGQINAVVPYEIAGRVSTTLLVTYNNVPSNSITLNVSGTAPGIFTVDTTGGGQGDVFNTNYTVANSSTPASRGGTVIIYATGEGQTNPAGVTGLVIGSIKNPVAQASLTIGGQPATIQFIGEAPGDVSGVLQINATVPQNINPGSAVPVVLTIGGVASQANVTMAVQ